MKLIIVPIKMRKCSIVTGREIYIGTFIPFFATLM